VIATNPQVEVFRRRAFETFKRDCLESLERIIKPLKIKLPLPSMLEKWHMDCKHEERQRIEVKLKNHNHNGYPILASTEKINAWTMQDYENYFDPILLTRQASMFFAPILKQETNKIWRLQQQMGETVPSKFGKKLSQVQKSLVQLIMSSRESFTKQLRQAAKQAAIRSTKKMKFPKIETSENLMHVTFAGNSFKIHQAYYEKLQRLFDRQQRKQPNNFIFEEALFCMLCRYDMLQGAGLQAGVPGSIMDVLLEKLQCHMECFASPLNCRYDSFASAFELDMIFGSKASFFRLTDLPSGCYQANPPFCEGVISALANKIQGFLSKASEALMFVVFVPAWRESDAYQKLLEHSFLAKHILLDQGNHFYAEGTQHRRNDSFRLASFDTSIFVYQNEAAKSKWKVSEDLENALEEAFCTDPGTMNKIATKKMASAIRSSVPLNADNKSLRQPKKGSLTNTLPKQKTSGKKKKRGKKRSFTSHEEENKAHFGVLASLGLSMTEGSSTFREVDEEKIKDFSTKKKKRKKKN
jgi:hypothetical protein